MQKVRNKKTFTVGVVVLIISLILVFLYSVPIANLKKRNNTKASINLISNGIPAGFTAKIDAVECYEASRHVGPGPTYCQVLFKYLPRDSDITLNDYQSVKATGWQQWYSQPSNLTADSNFGNKNWLSHLSERVEGSPLSKDSFNCDLTISSTSNVLEGRCLWVHKDFYSLFPQ